jgi:hypothetical protein
MVASDIVPPGPVVVVVCVLREPQPGAAGALGHPTDATVGPRLVQAGGVRRVLPALLLALVALLGGCALEEDQRGDPDVGTTGSDDADEATDASVPEGGGDGPRPGATFQWQLSGYPPDLSVDAEVYDLDLFETPDAALAELEGRGVTTVCYFSAGTYEDFREDAAGFPEDARGEPLPDFPDERWLDVRRIDDLAPVIEARLDLCAERGFDAVEMDNVDAYANDSGFDLTAEDQIEFNRWLASEARERGLSPGLKGTAELAGDLVDDFDWALVEQCIEYDECEAFRPFVDDDKAVFVVEYEGSEDEVCRRASELDGMVVMRADYALDGPVDPC